ncbi:MAG: hypothetical protein HW409_1132 [candidate division NC10 bacterium]|nr:hypothetical protein [candidate division NC10 bacterium]
MGPVEHEMDIDVAPLRAAVAHRRRAREVPHPGLETKILLGEGSDRADVDDVARVRILQTLTRIEAQFSPVPSVENPELACLGDLVGEAHAAGAKDAAFLVQHHVGADGHGLLLLDLLLSKPGIVEPEVHVEVLEVAFARLVADRAVERVVRQEKFQHGAPAVFSLGTLGVHHHSFSDRRVAGDLELGDLLHFHQADPTVSSDGKPRVIAIARDEIPELLRSLDNR